MLISEIVQVEAVQVQVRVRERKMAGCLNQRWIWEKL